MQTVIFDIWSWWKASRLPILLRASFVLISVTKLWDIILRLCMCRGRTHHIKVLQSNSHCKTANMFGFFLLETVKWQSKSNIADEMGKQNLIVWRHASHRNSVQCAERIDMNNNLHAAFIYVSNHITLRTDMVYMIEILEIVYGRSWKLRRRSWICNSEEVVLYLPKTSEMIYMPSIAGRECGNVLHQRQL
jgi:hypothetical protein